MVPSMSVLCLIANPAEPMLDPALAGAIHREIAGEINWLAPGIACDSERQRARRGAPDSSQVIQGSWSVIPES